MRNVTTVPAAMLICVLLVGVTSAANKEDAPGRLHLVEIEKTPHPKANHPNVGDLTKCWGSFAVTPDTMVDDIEVTVEGKAIQYVAFVDSTRPKIVGATELSIYLLAVRPGLSHVEFKILREGKKPETIKMAFLVTPQGEGEGR